MLMFRLWRGTRTTELVRYDSAARPVPGVPRRGGVSASVARERIFDRRCWATPSSDSINASMSAAIGVDTGLRRTMEPGVLMGGVACGGLARAPPSSM